MKISPLFSMSIIVFGLLLVAGCSSVRTQDSNGLVSYSDGTETKEDLPLLPRTSAKDSWAKKSSPLPPPPSSVEQDLTYDPEPEPRTARKEVELKEVRPDELDDLIRANRGKVLMVNCWGIDCGPCVEELPHLDKLQRRLEKNGLKVVTINTDVEDRHEEVKEFVEKNGFGFDVYLRAPGSDIKFRQSIDPEYAADPYTLIFDKEGNRVATIADALPEATWEKVAKAVLNNEEFPMDTITDPEVVRLY
ncbi:MAG: TlpA family protein disulfide reductase [Candidatus Omnitrophica bacterium]|nr:TlpA family protein disulfide reductase [Candidatus Omnitrophota bacterium]MCA9425158.1 TlpA family protein disulfide reductase [Candidatus Omnitrophota bacterium]MCA9431318.1 TlpA family protein disulfide reductase [Candidatus Omnitrophota bacterium]MCA9442636.1 TlpA family protein disulfide reductase [Candidatus Omnitrophota bacterium]MCB9770569.1 TlpA family protein disulfide reductase [Candidatus Omnitrophota bacterium]